MRFLFTCIAAVGLVAGTGFPTAAYAQGDDDDLLGGLGDDEDEEPVEEAPAEDEDLDDVDVDAPLDDIDDGESDAAAEGEGDGETETIEAESADAGPTPEEKAEEEARSKLAGDPASLDRVKAVQRKPVLKRMRVELTPTVGVSINDSFFTHLSAGVSAIFYPHDNFGIGLNGFYFLGHFRSANLRTVRIGYTAVPAVFEFPTGGASLDFYWSPIYGKISLADSLILSFDLYASAGVGLVSVDPNIRPTFNATIGQRVLFNDWMAIRVELNDMMYNDTQSVEGQPHSDIQNYMMFRVGVSFFIPPTFEYTTL